MEMLPRGKGSILGGSLHQGFHNLLAYVTIWRFKYSVKLLISVDFLVYHHNSVVLGIGLVNRTSGVQIRRRLLLKVTELSFRKSYFYQKMIFHLLFVHSYLSYVTSFLFRLDLSNFIQV